MKNLYHKNKGKVYPSPSSSSSSSSSCGQNGDAFSVFKLLPVAILALVSVLSLEDREVLAYLITRSMKTANPSSMIEEKKKSNKPNNTHKPPIFDCGCFDCYTSYWFRWDSSPNRELIHQAIEAFEEHLTNGELSKKNNSSKGGKKKDKMGHRVNGKTFNKQEKYAEKQENRSIVTAFQGEPPEKSFLVTESDDSPVVVSNKSDGMFEKEESCEEVYQMDNGFSGELYQTVEENIQFPDSVHKGLVRKVLPDVMGIFNSRLWNLWNPNV